MCCVPIGVQCAVLLLAPTSIQSTETLCVLVDTECLYALLGKLPRKLQRRDAQVLRFHKTGAEQKSGGGEGGLVCRVATNKHKVDSGSLVKYIKPKPKQEALPVC